HPDRATLGDLARNAETTALRILEAISPSGTLPLRREALELLLEEGSALLDAELPPELPEMILQAKRALAGGDLTGIDPGAWDLLVRVGAGLAGPWVALSAWPKGESHTAKLP